MNVADGPFTLRSVSPLLTQSIAKCVLTYVPFVAKITSPDPAAASAPASVFFADAHELPSLPSNPVGLKWIVAPSAPSPTPNPSSAAHPNTRLHPATLLISILLAGETLPNMASSIVRSAPDVHALAQLPPNSISLDSIAIRPKVCTVPQ